MHIPFQIRLILILGHSFLLASCEKEDAQIRYEHKLPVIEIEIEAKYLWSADSGLYVIGNNGIMTDALNGCNNGFPANYNQKWEYPAWIRYTPEEAETPAFEEQVGFRIKGNCSREKAMKSLGLYWRAGYGSKSIEYPIFPDGGRNRFKRLLLRNSGNDFGLTQLKDAAVVQIFKDYARVDYQEYRPSVLYLNGEYWGIHNIREMITPHHFSFHYQVDDDLVDLLEESPMAPKIDDGSSEAFLREVVEFIQDHDLSDKENYQVISERIDMGNFIDYMIIETYVGNRDWPVTNSRWWRENKEGGQYTKWRWIAFDHDVAFRSEYVNEVWIGDLYGEDKDPSKGDGFYIFNKLILNEAFRQDFLSRYQFFIDTVFDPDRVEMIVLKMKERLREEYPRHQKKWNTLPVWRWESAIDEIISVNRKRNEIMKGIIISLHEES